MNPLSLLVSASLLLSLTVQGAALAPEQPARRVREAAGSQSAPSSAPTAAATIRAAIATTLAALSDHGDFALARAELQRSFDQAIAYAADDAALIRDSAFALRLVMQLAAADPAHRMTLYRFLRANEAVARELAFLVEPQDDPARAYEILAELHAASERSVVAFPSLAAAICIVHDRPISAGVSTRDNPREIDPVAVFAYYVRNADKMVCSPRTTAPELLIHIVDTQAEPHELEWALAKHRGDSMVHKRYNDLVYDTANFKYNRPKKISAHAYTLENLRRYGGVCAEQAYYAENVAKAIGVPSVTISGHGGGIAHAWVGVLLVRGSTPAWYMEEGRYEDYEDIRGNVRCPQTGISVTDDQIALSARVARTPARDRHTARAYLDASRRIFQAAGGRSLPGSSAAVFASDAPREGRSEGSTWPPPLEAEGLSPPAPLQASNAAALKLLESAANASPAMPSVWKTMADAAAAGRLSKADRARWFDAFFSAVGADHPDYCFGILATIAASIDNPAEQAAVWDWAGKKYHQRKDLCARALIGRGDGWKKAGRHHEAYTSYMEVVNRYANDTAEVMIALANAERLLNEGNRQGHAVEMYKTAFQRVRRPDNVRPGAFRQTNFYRIGSRYATLLEESGRAAQARSIRNQLKAGEDKD